MDKKVLVFGALTIFGLGNISGQILQSAVMKKKLRKMLPLLKNAIADVVTRAIDEKLTREEARIIMMQELEFMTIVIKNRSF